MPNPFTAFTQQNRGRQPRSKYGPRQDPTGTVGFTDGPETPLAVDGEHYASDVNAYRGTETHGVTPNVKWNDTDPITPDDAIVEFEIPDPEPEPVPVRIVYGDKSKELVKATVIHAFATPNVQSRILHRDIKRRTAKITNLHATDTVWISPDPSVQIFTGYPIKAGAEFVSTSAGQLWVVSGTANTVELAVYHETSYSE